MSILKNKKLLILGASSNEVSLVQRAQELGVYVIVTDYNNDYELSPAKKIADEVWNISWSELDILENKCRENNVNGILAGYSEIRVENMIKLCERLNLPSYITLEQLDVTRDKVLFKNACREAGVPVVNEYSSPADVNHFPVIVKPVDRAGSIGISIANNQKELEKAYDYALEMSIRKKVIIEDFINDGYKIDLYYAIVNSKIYCLSSDDVINSEKNGTDKVIQNGWVLPSKKHKIILEKVDNQLKTMIKNQKIHDGYIFFSGFARPNDEFVFFECGFRLCGGYLFNYFPYIGGYNNMDIFLYYALTGSTEEIQKSAINIKDLKCVTVNIYAKSGTIEKIEGFDKVAKMKDCNFCVVNAHKGQVCDDSKAILSSIGRFYFCNTSSKQLAKDVEKSYKFIDVRDTHGKDMVYDKFEPKILIDWWNE